jgi:hypothetical protein
LTLTTVTFLYTKIDSELVYQAEHVAPISNKFYIGEAPSDSYWHPVLIQDQKQIQITLEIKIK